jgi:hypothetical protein
MKTHELSYPKGRAPIRPELLAAKLASIRNHEAPELLEEVTRRPRLVEMLWFIQYMSIQPGGLLKFCEDMIQQMPERFGTRQMLSAKRGPLSLDTKLKIYSELPDHFHPPFPELNPRDEHLLALFAMEGRDGCSHATDEDRATFSNQLESWTIEAFRDCCLRGARELLPEYLTALCIEKDNGFKPRTWQDHSDAWFIDDPVAVVLEMMDSQAARAKSRIAMTEVARLIFDRLDYALAEKVMVRIEGGSRFGKTEALSAWVEMRPGLARMVRVPCDNSMASFFKRIGEAIGIDCSYGSSPSRLKERIEYVIQHGGLFLVLDEGHFLAPMNFTATTPPNRLNWVRTEIVDRGLPLAISVTPQAFKGAIDRFVKKTRYDMTQFFGRDFLPCVLPEVLSEDDLIAVARIHFPGFGDNALGYIANEARLSQNYLQAVEAIARRTRFLAGKRGGAVKLKDIETAVSEVLPRRQLADKVLKVPVPEESSRNRQPGADGSRFDGSRQAGPVPGDEVLNAPLKPTARGVQPARMGVPSDHILDSRSLRGSGPRKADAELVSAED